MQYSIFQLSLLILVVVATVISSTNSSVVISRDSDPRTSGLDTSTQVLLAKTISQNVITRLEKQFKESSLIQNPKGTLLPPIDDPACLQPGKLTVNITIPPVTLVGTLELTSPSVVTGLSNIVDDFVLQLGPPVKITWNLQIPNVELSGEYGMDLILDAGYPSSVLGTGNLVASASSVFLNLNATLRAPIVGPMALANLGVDLGVSSFAIDANGARINETAIDWINISEYLQTYLDTIWNDETQPLITEMVRCAVDHVINGCNINEILQEKYDCLKPELKPECFNGESVKFASFVENEMWVDSCPVNSEEPSQGTGQTDPIVTTPGNTDPTVTTPGNTDPTVTTPGNTDPTVTTPGQTDPNVTTPVQTDPTVVTPGKTDPTVTTPESASGDAASSSYSSAIASITLAFIAFSRKYV